MRYRVWADFTGTYVKYPPDADNPTYQERHSLTRIIEAESRDDAKNKFQNDLRLDVHILTIHKIICWEAD
jgi:hypothetical protein